MPMPYLESDTPEPIINENNLLFGTIVINRGLFPDDPPYTFGANQMPSLYFMDPQKETFVRVRPMHSDGFVISVSPSRKVFLRSGAGSETGLAMYLGDNATKIKEVLEALRKDTLPNIDVVTDSNSPIYGVMRVAGPNGVEFASIMDFRPDADVKAPPHSGHYIIYPDAAKTYYQNIIRGDIWNKLMLLGTAKTSYSFQNYSGSIATNVQYFRNSWATPEAQFNAMKKFIDSFTDKAKDKDAMEMSSNKSNFFS